MSFEKVQPRWRCWLTEDEEARVAEIDATISSIRDLATERARIANRALQRARYYDQKERA